MSAPSTTTPPSQFHAGARPRRAWISRYAWSQEDYHEAVLRKAARGGSKLQQDVPGLQTRCYVDTGPLRRTRLGQVRWRGMERQEHLHHQSRLGSWLFLGRDPHFPRARADLPAPDRCGTCTRCIDACPTDAFLAPYQLDSNRCISYLTIEKRGEIAEDLREGTAAISSAATSARTFALEPQSAGQRRAGIRAARRPGQSRAGMAGGMSARKFRDNISSFAGSPRQAQRPAPQCGHRHGQQRRSALCRPP